MRFPPFNSGLATEYQLCKPWLRFVVCKRCGVRFAAPPPGQALQSRPASKFVRYPFPAVVNREPRLRCDDCYRLPTRTKGRPSHVRRMLGAAYEWLKTQPCTDCGLVYHPHAMEFDHLPGFEKVGVMNQIVKSGDLGKFVDELLKCELVCANCHRVRTDVR